MAQQDDRTYFERRLRESRELARTAADPGVARIHRTYAAQYEQRLREQASATGSSHPPLGLVAASSEQRTRFGD